VPPVVCAASTTRTGSGCCAAPPTVLREAGFTEQRILSASNGGRITGRRTAGPLGSRSLLQRKILVKLRKKILIKSRNTLRRRVGVLKGTLQVKLLLTMQLRIKSPRKRK
jgi:hypothetical protein